MFYQQSISGNLSQIISMATAVLCCISCSQSDNGGFLGEKQTLVTIHRQQPDCVIDVQAFHNMKQSGSNFDELEGSEETFKLDVSKLPSGVDSLQLEAVCRDNENRIVEMGSATIGIPLNAKATTFSLARLDGCNQGHWCPVRPPIASIAPTALWAGDSRHAAIVARQGKMLVWDGYLWNYLENTLFDCLDFYDVTGSVAENTIWTSAVPVPNNANCTNAPLFNTLVDRSFLSWITSTTPRDQPNRIRFGSIGSLYIFGPANSSKDYSYVSLYSGIPGKSQETYWSTSGLWLDVAFSYAPAQTMPWFLWEQSGTQAKWYIMKNKDDFRKPIPDPIPPDSNFIAVSLQQPASLSVASDAPMDRPNIWLAGKKSGQKPPVSMVNSSRIETQAGFGDSQPKTESQGCFRIFATSSNVAYAACDSMVLRCTYEETKVICSPVLELAASPRDSLISIHGSRRPSGMLQLWAIGMNGAIWLYEGPE